MKYYVVEPEVAGGWGENSVVDRPPGKATIVRKLHYEFDGWLGDELLESTPCFIATERLAEAIVRSQLTGVRFDVVEVTTSSEFDEIYPGRKLPAFVWLQIEGRAGKDNLGITPELRLVVSATALQILQSVGIDNAVVTAFAE